MMGLVLRRADDPSFEVTLGDKLLSLGSDAACDVRLAGPGIAGMHLRISAVAIEALVAVTVGGIRLGAGRSRRCVPSRLRVGEASFTIESVGESSVATRELVLRALAVGADLGPRIVVVEGPSSGRELLLQAGRGCTVGRDPSSDLAVDDPEVSRAHFEVGIVEGDGSVFIRDSGSNAGLWLGGMRLEARRKAEWPFPGVTPRPAQVFRGSWRTVATRR